MLEALSSAPSEPSRVSVPGEGPRLVLSHDLQGGAADEVFTRLKRDESKLALLQQEEPFVPTHDPSFVKWVAESILTRGLLASAEGNAGLSVSVGMILLACGQNDEAERILAPIAGSGSDYWSEYYLAQALSGEGRFEEAEALLRDSVSARGDDFRPRHALGRLLMTEHRWREAREQLSAACAFEDASSAAFNDLGIAALGDGDHVQAEAEFQNALFLDPFSTIARCNIATSLMFRHKFDDAFAAFENVLSLDPSCVAAIHNLGELLIARKDYESAVKLLRRRLDVAPDDIQARNACAWALLELDRPAQATEILRRAVELTQFAEPALLNNLGLARARCKEMREAEQSFRRAHMLAPHDTQIRANFAALHRSIGSRDALDLLNEATVDEIVGAAVLRIELLGAQGRAEEAMVAVDRAIEKHGPDIRFLYAKCFLIAVYATDIRSELPVIRKILADHPSDRLLLANCVYALLQANCLDEAELHLSSVLREVQGGQDSHSVCLTASYGLLLIRRGQFNEGMEQYRAALYRARGTLHSRIRLKILLEEARHLEAVRRSQAVRKLEQLLPHLDEFPEFARDTLDLYRRLTSN